MALNVSVNVEWWSAGKLYQHYQDQERYTIKNELNAPDVATASLTRPTGTVAQRDTKMGATSVLYSADLDPEAYVEPGGEPANVVAALKTGGDAASAVPNTPRSAGTGDRVIVTGVPYQRGWAAVRDGTGAYDADPAASARPI
jgi:hypothetical protein